MPPFARVSRSWQLWGHRRAAVLVLQDVWEKALLLDGKGTEDCPVQGLFGTSAEAEAALPAPGGAAAASGH